MVEQEESAGQGIMSLMGGGFGKFLYRTNINNRVEFYWGCLTWPTLSHGVYVYTYITGH